MPPPDWTTLRLFLAAVEHGSITRAAAARGIATSAAAKRLADLEAEAGVALLEKTPRGARATAAGEGFARHARALLDLAARLGDDLRAYAAGGLGSARLHATASAIGGHALAESLAAFTAAHPGIRVELREETSLPILRDLAEGRADLGLVTSAGPVPAGLEARPWREDRLLCVVNSRHRFVGRDAIPFAEVLDEPFVGVLTGGALALLLGEEAARLGRAPRTRFEVASPDAARRLVAAGLGVTVMPDGIARGASESLGLRGVPLADPWAVRRLRLVARPDAALPPPARLLLDHLLRS